MTLTSILSSAVGNIFGVSKAHTQDNPQKREHATTATESSRISLAGALHQPGHVFSLFELGGIVLIERAEAQLDLTSITINHMREGSTR